MILILLAAALATPTSVADVRWERRVLLIVAPRDDDAELAAQRKALAGWDREARERDLAIVTVVGGRVTGVRDSAGKLRKRYRLPTDGFAALLIGKDGGVKMRSVQPIAPEVLAETIDAMPMRRAGGR